MSVISPLPRPRWNVALIVSLSLNLLLAGVIAMAAFRLFVMHQPIRPFVEPPPMDRMMVRKLLTPRTFLQVSPVKADAIRDVVRQHHDRIMALKAESFAARHAVMDVFTAPKFDRAAFDKALARMQAADIALGSEALKVTSESSALLSSQERQKVMTLQPHGPGFHGGHPPRGGDFDGPPPGGRPD